MLDLYESGTKRKGIGRLRRRIYIIATVIVFGGIGAWAVASALGDIAFTQQRANPWRGAGPEPAARAWAVRIEGSLAAACTSSYQRIQDKRLLLAQLTQKAAVAARSSGSAAPVLRLSPEEQRDALDSLDSAGFAGICLARAYEAIIPCERWKEDLGGAPARRCMFAPVLNAVVPLPFQRCAARAKLPRVRDACALMGTEAQEQVQAHVATEINRL